jgi:hypothetical protein
VKVPPTSTPNLYAIVPLSQPATGAKVPAR